jgi:hypothetical protein
MLNKEELKMSLKLYKDSLGPERYKVKPSARVPVSRTTQKPLLVAK